MTNRSHDWQTPPTEWRYDGQPLAEFEDAMTCEVAWTILETPWLRPCKRCMGGLADAL